MPLADLLRGMGDRAPNNVVGIVAMLAATAIFVTGDMIMKLMAARLPTGETMFIRGLIGTAMCWSLLAAFGLLGDVRRHLTRMVGYRTGCEVGASCFFQTGLTRLPFAEVGAIGQINPLMVTAAAAVFLGEKVGWRRWTATAIGLVGALLIIRPGGATFQWASLLILGAVFCSVTRDMVTRKMDVGVSPFVLAAISSTAIGASSLLFLPFETWIWPSFSDVLWLAFPALFMMMGQTLVVISIRAGDVSAVVPFRYAAILWSLFYSFLIWREVPDAMTFLGIAIVCSAGLYTFHREQVRRREAASKASEAGKPETVIVPPAADGVLGRMVFYASPALQRTWQSGMHFASTAYDSGRSLTSRTSGVLLGIAAMTASMLCFSIGDTLFKIMGATLPIGEMLFVRGIFATIIVFAVLTWLGVVHQLPQLATPLVGVRVLCEGLCSILFFVGLMRMQFADAAAIGQFTPLVVMAGAALFLGEKVGWRRWASAGVGLLGVLLIIKPGTSAFQPMAIVLLVSMIFVAIRDLVTRGLSKRISTPLLTFSSAAAGLVCGLLMAPFEAAWVWPSATAVLIMAISAVTVLGGYAFGIMAMSLAAPSITSPFRYAYMLFATLSSLVIFRERPDLWSWMGITLIVAAGLYVLHRERVVGRKVRGQGG